MLVVTFFNSGIKIRIRRVSRENVQDRLQDRKIGVSLTLQGLVGDAQLPAVNVLSSSDPVVRLKATLER